MRAFTHSLLPGRVVFGRGCIGQLPDELQRFGAHRAIVLCTPEQRPLAERLAAALGMRAAGVFTGAAMHVPVEAAEAARAFADERGADCAVAVGGGSTIGLGKAIALTSGLPILAVPTTYAGSEATSIYGLTEAGVKRTGRDPRVLPRTVLYDPDLSLTLPQASSITSGINAMAHAAEGLYAQDATPITRLMAEEGLRQMAHALPRLAADAQDIEARSDALYGAWLCGSVLGNVGMALHHKLCHVLGGSFDLPHAEVHTVVLPHALAYNAPAATEATVCIARALGLAEALQVPTGLQALAARCGAPTALGALGMRATDLDRAADLACESPYWNPRPIERHAIRILLQRAFEGAAPC